MNITIYDIAQKCHVSIATVSRVLNGSSRVSEKTRAKVLQVMKEMGYKPNPFARGLGLDSMKSSASSVPMSPISSMPMPCPF